MEAARALVEIKIRVEYNLKSKIDSELLFGIEFQTMGISERKEREFAAREKMVVAEADILLKDHGYLGLNLDELAERVEYSKATLYHHFKSKEDLVLAVVLHHFSIRQDYFTRASEFDGLTRERIFAIGIADRLLSLKYPHGFPLVQLVRQPSIWAKCSEERQAVFFDISTKCFEKGMLVAGDALENGDLSDFSPAPDQLIWGLVSFSKGAHLIAEELLFDENGDADADPLKYLFDNYHLYLDGAGWKPLSRDFNYSATRKRIEKELFPEEMAAFEA